MGNTYRYARLLLLVGMMSLSVLSHAQQPIQLPQPTRTGGKPLMDCLNQRRSVREYSDKALELQQISDLLWAADGINRPEEGKRTAPNSRNRQEIDIYVVMKEGTYLYDHRAHALLPRLEGDYRALSGKQDFVGTAFLNLLYVANYGRIEADPAAYRTTSGINIGLIVQNVYLYCASEGLGTVVRGYFDPAPLHRLLGLDEKQEVLLTQSVGALKE